MKTHLTPADLEAPYSVFFAKDDSMNLIIYWSALGFWTVFDVWTGKRIFEGGVWQ